MLLEITKSEQTANKACCYKITSPDLSKKTEVTSSNRFISRSENIIKSNYVLLIDNNLCVLDLNRQVSEYEFTTHELMCVSEKVLAKDWLLSEEDEAWQDL
ncbi:MAG: hypothetical protein KKD38_00410 [Candidatus Delongbacteria bacterium]|nr:hypothetical protein [Candidatus Delongbacteria bacterium]MCG2761358.1 hypothetical protein [Candidatus Delongbacteria bacterium]